MPAPGRRPATSPCSPPADPTTSGAITGRIETGSIKVNDPTGGESGRSACGAGLGDEAAGFRGLNRTPVDLAEAGDIVAIAG